MIGRAHSAVAFLAVLSVTLLIGCEPNKAAPDDPPPAPPPFESDVANQVDTIPGSSAGDIVFWARNLFSGELYAVSGKATDFRRITRIERTSPYRVVGNPTLPSDGSIIYYPCLRAICSMGPDGSAPRAVLEGEDLGNSTLGFHEIDVSPDGKQLLISASPFSVSGNPAELYVYDLESGTSRKLTDDEAHDVYPSWTPSGGIVWERDTEGFGHSDIVTVPAGQVTLMAGGARASLVTPSIIVEGNEPDVSPDGTKIAFRQRNCAPDCTFDVSSVNIDGTNEQVLAETSLDEKEPAWSPDGSEVVFVRPPERLPDRVVPDDLYKVAATGGVLQRITSTPDVSETRPTWTDLPQTASLLPPDCAEVDPQCPHSVEESDSGNVSLEFDVKLSERPAAQVVINYRVVAGSAVATQDYIAPAPATLTFATNDTSEPITVQIVGDDLEESDESFYVELLPSTGVKLGVARRQGVIVNDDAPPPSPSPSVSPPAPVEELIAYQSGQSVWTVRPDGTLAHEVVASGASPDLLPGDDTIVFSQPPTGSTADLFQVGVGGGTPTRLNGTPSYDGSPSWAPGAHGVAWVQENGGALTSFFADPATGTPQSLVSNGLYPDWGEHPRGREVIAVSEADGLIYFYDPSTKARIGGSVADGIFPAISPDGTKLAYADDLHGDMDIFVKDLTSGAAPLHLTTSSAQDTDPQWSPNGQFLAFVTNRAGNNDIYKIGAGSPDTEVPLVATAAQEQEPSWGGGTAPTLQRASSNVAPVESPSPSPSSSPLPAPSPTSSALLIPIGLVLGAGFLRGRRRERR